ncbi:MAG: DnaJ domain-containing protein [Chloroflexi bacterium]|nr:DnaJ domain-containing protein [Chloroflexota bacterium]
MPEQSDPYAILQVSPQAEPEIIQAAYRRLAAKYHPDVNGSPEALRRMQEINAAYDLLSDPQKRAAYDRWRAQGGGSAPRPPIMPSGLDWRRLARQYAFPAAVFIFFLLAPRVGPRGALVMTALIALLAYLIIWQRR